MSTIFRSMVGAAMLVAAGASTASAQDYTWTLSNFSFGDYWTMNPFAPSGTETGSGATGTLVMTKTGANAYDLKSFNFTTTLDASSTGYAYTYDSSVNLSFDPGTTPFDEGIEMYDASTGGNYAFRVTWGAGELFGAMNGGVLNTAIDASTPDPSYEYDLAGDEYMRFSSARAPGVLTLTDITDINPTPTPEPASLALLGTGLLGILVARRRKNA